MRLKKIKFNLYIFLNKNMKLKIFSLKEMKIHNTNASNVIAPTWK